MKKALRIVGWILFAIFVLATVGVVGYGITTQFILKKEAAAPIPGQPGIRPDFEKLDLTIPTTEAEKKQFAYDLYTLANKNFKEIENAAYAINCTTEMMGAAVIGYQYMVKNGDEYYYTEYSFAEAGGGPIDMGMIMAAVSPDSTAYAARTYTDASLDKMYKHLVHKPSMKVDENKKITFETDWVNDDTMQEYELNKKIYYKDQAEPFEYTEQRILPETILTVDIEYNEEEGYYRLVVELDVTNEETTKITRPNLRNSSGADDADYYSMTETIEIWDNGYFKYFRSQDNWRGKMGGVLTLDSKLDYITNFYYDETNCNPANYQDMLEWKAEVLAK